jgi:hypothetical protein
MLSWSSSGSSADLDRLGGRKPYLSISVGNAGRHHPLHFEVLSLLSSRLFIHNLRILHDIVLGVKWHAVCSVYGVKRTYPGLDPRFEEVVEGVADEDNIRE